MDTYLMGWLNVLTIVVANVAILIWAKYDSKKWRNELKSRDNKIKNYNDEKSRENR